MSIKRKFSFPMSTLVREARLILSAAESHPVEITKRLGADATLKTQGMLNALTNRTSTQAKSTSDVGDLTGEQDDGVIVLLDLFGLAKDSAKRAFKGQDVKLGSEFKVGVNSPSDLGSVLERAGVVRDSCAKEENAAALAKKGWIAEDTAALTAAIAQVEAAERGQERGMTVQIAATDARNAAANDVFEDLLTIQNAANIQWPERIEANRAVRREFRLDVFPPSPGAAKVVVAKEDVPPAKADVPAGSGSAPVQ